MRKGSINAAPSILETIRLNLTVLERSIANGDTATAKRSIDAAERMFAGLRDVASGQGCDVGASPPVWGATPTRTDTARQGPTPPDTARQAPTPTDTARQGPTLPDTARQGPTPPDTAVLAPSRPDVSAPSPSSPAAELEIERLVRDAIRRNMPTVQSALATPAWLEALRGRQWTGALLARLVWLTTCCALALVWRAGRGCFTVSPSRR